MRIQQVYRSLQYPNYRLYFFGQSVSLIGTWMQRMAVSWLVYRLTGSAFMLGIVIFAAQFPTFLLSPYGGVISDRYDRYKILLLTQVASMLQAGILAGMVLSGYYNITAIILLSVLLGMINAFDTPSRQSLLVIMVDNKTDLPNAIALNSSMVNLGRLLGPTIAGLVLASLGEGACFLINALSFVAVIVSLLCMKLPKQPYIKPVKNIWADFRDGFDYLQQTDSLKNIIILMACISFLLMPFSTLLPVIAKEVFKGGAGTFGLINGISGLGALVGAFNLAILKPGKSLNKMVLYATFIFSIFLFLFSSTSYLPLALLYMAVTGFGMMTCMAVGNTFIQTHVDDKMRGRVMSFYSMAFFGMQPFGSFLMGTIADYMGARLTIGLEGIAGLVTAIIFIPRLTKKSHYTSAAEKNIAEKKRSSIMLV
jgi:MFS family permease